MIRKDKLVYLRVVSKENATTVANLDIKPKIVEHQVVEHTRILAEEKIKTRTLTSSVITVMRRDIL